MIARSLRVYGSNFRVLIPYLLLFSAPVELLGNYPLDKGGMPQALFALFSALLDMAANAVFLPAVFYALLHSLEGKRIPGMGDCLRWGTARSARLFRWNLLYWLRVLFWSMVLVAPGLVVFLRYSLLPLVVILEPERKNPMGRAREILRGRLGMFSAATTALLFMPVAVSTALEVVLRYRFHLAGHWLLFSLCDFLTDLAIFPYAIMTLLAYRAWASEGEGWT